MDGYAWMDIGNYGLMAIDGCKWAFMNGHG